MHKSIFLVLFSLVVSAASTEALALPVLSRHQLMRPLKTLPGFRFDGIVKLPGCSGSLVRFQKAAPTDRALVLTNGHCIGSSQSEQGFLRYGEVLYHFPRQIPVTFLDRKANALGTLVSTQIIYATMTGTDMALLELPASYQEIYAKIRVGPLILAATAPKLKTEIDVPSGYWKKTYSCALDAVVPYLKEGEWIFTNSLRYTQPGCETIGGTSGSPVVSLQTGQVIAINNTGNEDGLNCEVNNPCEMNQKGQSRSVKGAAYAQQTALIYTCLTPDGRILDLRHPNCQLAKPQALRYN